MALAVFDLLWIAAAVVAFSTNGQVQQQRRQQLPVTRALQFVSNEEDVINIAKEARTKIKAPRPNQQQPRPNNRRKIKISNVQQLHEAILDEGHSLQSVDASLAEFAQVDQVLHHDVVELMTERRRQQTTPGNRNDTATLALAIEGGGMRGAVSAGMAAAIYALGFVDTLDVIYGSSAGSIIGAYMVTRQLSVDVYTDLLPNSNGQFLCKRRLIRSLLSNFANQVWGLPKLYEKPGMNTSYVLDTILPETGLRPLDMETFWYNNEHHQSLRVVSSVVKEDGTLESRVFGTDDFTTATTSSTGRSGLFACLEASMMVPGATGAPVEITRDDKTVHAFDAFCFEPLPYRSAVEEGATHVLVLRSRPQDFRPKTQPTIYETTVAPLYFQSHGQPSVAEFFQQGGQQYIYLEDHMVLEEARVSNKPVAVPPPTLQYGVKQQKQASKDRSKWKRAQMFPIVVPHGTPELPTLEQDSQVILEAVRGGFAAAFDILAPTLGIDDRIMTGQRAAQLVFPDLENTARTNRKSSRFQGLFGVTRLVRQEPITTSADMILQGNNNSESDEEALALLHGLPSIGNLPSLHTTLEQDILVRAK